MHRFSCFPNWTFHFKTVCSGQKGRERKSLLCALSYLTLCCLPRNRPPPPPEHILWPNATLITHRGLTYQCKEWEGERRDLAQAQTTGAYSVALHEFNAQKGAFLGAGMATNEQFLVEIMATVPQSESLKLGHKMLGFDESFMIAVYSNTVWFPFLIQLSTNANRRA